LITKEPLDDISKLKEIPDCIPILTYERDSIWQTLLSVTVKSEQVNTAERKIRVSFFAGSEFVSLSGLGSITPNASNTPPAKVPITGNKDSSYRYQEVIPAEVVKLLEHPEGTIPLSRNVIFNAPLDREGIISDFKAIK